MTARSSAVSRAGTKRWRPAHASGSPSGARITTPRPTARVPDTTASRSSSNAASRARRAPVRPLGRGHGDDAARERYVSPPLHLKALVPDDVRFILERDARLLVPVGTCEQHGPHLPLGCDTIIVECLADDLSGALEILRAP